MDKVYAQSAYFAKRWEQTMATERDESRGEAETAQPAVPGLAEAAREAVHDALTSDAFRDAVAEVIRAQAGLIPTAHEVARAIREYDAEHDVPAAADRPEGHPVDPEDGLS